MRPTRWRRSTHTIVGIGVLVLVAAVVFGYAQQLGTRLLDNYADKLLNEVRPLPRSGDSEARQV